MGQKIHPVGMRLGITRTWDSRWFEKKHYVDWLHEDVAIRKSFNRWMRSASISKIEIERRANQARVIVNTAKPGIIIGKRGVGIDEIRKNLEQLTGKSVAGQRDGDLSIRSSTRGSSRRTSSISSRSASPSGAR